MHLTYPWQQQHWQHLLACKINNNVPHAILLHGAAGLGKADFANSLARLLLCADTKDLACGICAQCLLLASNNHPDLFDVGLLAQGKSIKVEHIREVISALSNTAHQGGYQVVVIPAADMMNVSAANALLKTLEEPMERVVFILTTSHLTQLPATIPSRCQLLTFRAPSLDAAQDWLTSSMQLPAGTDAKLLLALSANAPLQALKLAESTDFKQREAIFSNLIPLVTNAGNVLKCAEFLAALDINFVINTLMGVVTDLIKYKLGGQNSVINSDQLAGLQMLSEKLSLPKLFQLLDKLLELNKFMANGLNLNKQLMLEDLLFDWTVR